MTLLLLAIAYIIGVWLGSILAQMGVIGCDIPTWLWVAPLALLPLTPLLNRPQRAGEPLRWPEGAGFTRPQRGLRLGVIVAAALCLLMGGLRMASVSPTGCWRPSDLAAWNLPSDAAFDDDAPQVGCRK